MEEGKDKKGDMVRGRKGEEEDRRIQWENKGIDGEWKKRMRGISG
jgi:hypothetical protein